MPIRVTPDIIVELEGTLLVNTHGGTFHLQREGRADRSVQNKPTDFRNNFIKKWDEPHFLTGRALKLS